VNTPEPGTPGLAADVELDLLLLSARASTLHALDMALDIGAGLAAVQARHVHGAASRPPPARAGPVRLPPQDPLPDRDLILSHDEPRQETEGHSS
jgi:hypothetical protein